MPSSLTVIAPTEVSMRIRGASRLGGEAARSEVLEGPLPPGDLEAFLLQPASTANRRAAGSVPTTVKLEISRFERTGIAKTTTLSSVRITAYVAYLSGTMSASVNCPGSLVGRFWKFGW